MNKSFKLWIALLGIAAVSLSGCGKKADTQKPLDEVKREVETMSKQDLEGYARAYVREIQAKKSEAEKIAQELREVPLKDIFGEKAKNLKTQVAGLQAELSNLAERYQVYAKKFQEAGGDLSKVEAAK